jgi:hypothetical protein
MRQAHRCRGVADGGRNPLDRSVADIPYHEETGNRRLERERHMARRPGGVRPVRDNVASSQDIAALELDRFRQLVQAGMTRQMQSGLTGRVPGART